MSHGQHEHPAAGAAAALMPTTRSATVNRRYTIWTVEYMRSNDEAWHRGSSSPDASTPQQAQGGSRLCRTTSIAGAQSPGFHLKDTARRRHAHAAPIRCRGTGDETEHAKAPHSGSADRSAAGGCHELRARRPVAEDTAPRCAGGRRGSLQPGLLLQSAVQAVAGQHAERSLHPPDRPGHEP